MQHPKSREHQRIIDGSRAGPDFLQPERADYAWILGQMRLIVPDKSGTEDRSVRDENQCD